MTPATVKGVTIDVSDLERAVGFWTTLLDLDIVDERPPYVWLGEVGGDIRLILQQVPEPSSAKNRVHLDLVADDPEETMAMVVRIGGRRLSDVDTEEFAFTVMADPDDNEFCISRRASRSLLRTDPDAMMVDTPTRKEVMDT